VSLDDPAFRKFVRGMAKFSSDKVMPIHKQYNYLTGPIVEENSEDVRCLKKEWTMTVLHLTVEFSVRKQKVVEILEWLSWILLLHILSMNIRLLSFHWMVLNLKWKEPKICSQVEDGEEDAIANVNQDVRASSRLAAQPNFNMVVDERAQRHVSSRNLQGANLDSHNSFDLPDNDDIFAIALEM
jgi:hypothetical protein